MDKKRVKNEENKGQEKMDCLIKHALDGGPYQAFSSVWCIMVGESDSDLVTLAERRRKKTVMFHTLFKARWFLLKNLWIYNELSTAPWFLIEFDGYSFIRCLSFGCTSGGFYFLLLSPSLLDSFFLFLICTK